jgi:hypothetical protein
MFMRDVEAGEQRFCYRVERCQRRTLLALRDHHFMPEVFGVLLDGRQFGQRVLTHQEFL